VVAEIHPVSCGDVPLFYCDSDVDFWQLKWASGCCRCQGSVCDGRHWISGGQVLIIHQYNLLMQNKFERQNNIAYPQLVSGPTEPLICGQL